MQLQGYQAALKSHVFVWSLLDGLPSYTEETA